MEMKNDRPSLAKFDMKFRFFFYSRLLILEHFQKHNIQWSPESNDAPGVLISEPSGN